MSNSLASAVSMLDELNYLVWAKNEEYPDLSNEIIKAAKEKKLKELIDELVESSKGKAKEADFPTIDNINIDTEDLPKLKEQKEWLNKDNQACGCILLHLNEQISHVIDDLKNSNDVWKALEKEFGTSRPVLIFADFKQAISF
ncbi:hypothetical protein AX16_010359 [Volvariella volvacea WC 439]|nr:hypothetical protein AX16_010359 [Volvariella volvacea WC 439]